MTNHEIVRAYYSIVAPNGINISKRHKESYWIKYGHLDLYNLIIEKSNFLSPNKSYTLSQRITTIESNLNYHPLCVTCGEPVMFVERNKKLSIYCSKECLWKDPNLGKKRKASFINVDKEIASMKRKNTMVSKYGVEFNSQREDIKSILSQSKIKYSKPISLEKLSSFEWLYNEYITKQRTLVDIAEDLKLYYGTVGDYCVKHGFKIRQNTNYSLQEKQIGDWLNSLSVNWTSDRSILNGKEIDIYVENSKLGIELDGLYWHSFNKQESKEEKNIHLNKTLLAKEKGVRLLHILDYEWNNKKEIVQSMICSRLGITDKIHGRKCEVKIIDSKLSKEFITSNHIQGFTGSKMNAGLFNNNELVMVMTFGTPRFNKNYSWELIRLSSKINVTVVGGANKLFKYFLNNYNIGNGIICYSNRRYGEGDVYLNLGFTKEYSTNPGYYWTDGNMLWSRTKFQKNKLEKLLNIYNQDLSESENMFNNKYRRLWDCGNNVYIYKST